MMEQLPEVAIRTLVPFLETPTKLALRLTSTTTGEWVTTREFLSKLKVPINSDDDLTAWISKKEDPFRPEDDNLMKGWNNFYLQQALILYNPSTLSRFFTTFHSHLEKLELFHCSGQGEDCQLWKILSKLENLKHLTIHDLDISNIKDEALLQVPLGSEMNKLKQDLGLHKLCLQTFSIHQVSFSRPGDLRAWSGIFKLLAIEAANFITIPKPHYCDATDKDEDRGRITWSEVKTLQWALITEPMLASMEENPASNVGKILLDVKHLVPIHFGRLVERCMTMNRRRDRQFNLFFTQVHAKHVKYVFLMSGDDSEEEFLGRISTIYEKIDDRRPLRRWTGLEKLYIKSSRCDVRNYYENSGNDKDMIIFPALKKIQIEFDSLLKDDPGFMALHRLITLLFKVKRDSVREVVLKWSPKLRDAPEENVVDLYEIRENFGNLQKLVVVSKGGIIKRVV